MNSEENLAIEAINKALEGELDGVDVDKIIDFKLRRLDREYNETLAAEIKERVPEPEWQADFSDDYDPVPEVEVEAPKDYSRDFTMTSEQVNKIKSIMGKIQLKTPLWARNIPDSTFSGMLRTASK